MRTLAKTSRTFIRVAGLAIVALLTTGCLDKDTTQTIYLEADGSVTWTVLEKDIRSDGATADDRAREEYEFFAAARVERHPVALAFARLDPTDVLTTMVRDQRPYAVFTEARFPRLDMLMARFVEAAGLDGASTLERRGGTVTWTLTVYGESASSEWRGEDKAVDALAGSFEGCRFVLAAGRFTSAVGFELSGDKRAATLRLPKDSPEPDDALRLSLTWVEVERER